jgi:CheY-like chemotaxis protein
MILHESLKLLGANVDEAGSSEEALARAHQALREGSGYNFVFADAGLPGTDGFELARKVKEVARSAHHRPPCVAVMLSSYHVGEKLKAVEEGGNDSYLVKPVKRADLLQIIRHFLRQESGEAPVGAARTETPTLSGREPVLVVDDSEDNREIIQAFLRKSRLPLAFARDGLEAVKKFKEEKFDLILMDMQMPEMDGFTATREIRKLEAESHLPRTPIVALTAYALKQDQENCYQAGCDFHLAKPISKQKLIEVVQRFYNP